MIILEDSIKIKTTPEKIWDFLLNIEKNYKAWHPKDHVLSRWTKGKPLEVGSVNYFEEYIHGKVHKMKVVYTRSIQNKELEFAISNPFWRIFYPKSTFNIEQKLDECIFTAKIYFRLGPLSSRSKRIKSQLETVEKHMKEEGEYLKMALENEL